jgi:hypothetical protein
VCCCSLPKESLPSNPTAKDAAKAEVSLTAAACVTYHSQGQEHEGSWLGGPCTQDGAAASVMPSTEGFAVALLKQHASNC